MNNVAKTLSELLNKPIPERKQNPQNLQQKHIDYRTDTAANQIIHPIDDPFNSLNNSLVPLPLIEPHQPSSLVGPKQQQKEQQTHQIRPIVQMVEQKKPPGSLTAIATATPMEKPMQPVVPQASENDRKYGKSELQKFSFRYVLREFHFSSKEQKEGPPKRCN